MPVALKFTKPSTFVVRASGSVTFDEVQGVLDQMLAHPRLSDGVRVLTDARKVTGTPSRSELRDIAGNLKPLLARGVSAIAIVTSSVFVYGVARMFSVFAEQVNANVTVFRDMDDARRWLAEQTSSVSP